MRACRVARDRGNPVHNPETQWTNEDFDELRQVGGSTVIYLHWGEDNDRRPRDIPEAELRAVIDAAAGAAT